MVMIMVMIILQIDSNRMFSGFIGDCKISQVYCKWKSHVQKYDSTFSFVVRFQCTSIKVVCTVSKFPSCSRQPATVACWPLWKFGPIDWLIDWLVGPQKLFFTFWNQFNLGHASTQSCELPKRPILHIKIERCCTAHLEKNKATALRKKSPTICGGLSPLSPSWIGKKGWPKPASDFANSTTQSTSTTTLQEFIGDSARATSYQNDLQVHESMLPWILNYALQSI